MRAPETRHDWLALTTEELSVATAYAWAVRPECGAVVLFSGTVRNHAEGRTGVTALAYEAYEEHVVPRLSHIAGEIRRRWPDVGRVALWHRVGTLAVGESSVLVVVSSPHRHVAFEAGRFGIDALKATAPIWKKESWAGGEQEDWALSAKDVGDLAPAAQPATPDVPEVPPAAVPGRHPESG